MTKRNSAWRDFEKLVALIEAEAAPRGATVKSPDRIRDLVTGRSREVDASIRFAAGTVPILVTIECRNRTRRADDVWIEQLATKRQRLGAAKTIAVSSTGFSKSALVSAKHYGIELRELSCIRPEDMEGWFLPHGVVHLFRQAEDFRCNVLCGGATSPVPIDAMLPVFRHGLMSGQFPAAVFLSFIEMKDPKRLWAVPLDGTKTRLTFEFDTTSPDLIPVPLGVARPNGMPLKVLLESGEAVVVRLELSVLISYEAAVLDREQGKHHVYSTPEGKGIQHSTFKGEVFGLPVRFDHQQEPDGRVSSSVQWPSGLRLPSTVLGVPHETKKDDKDVAGAPIRPGGLVTVVRKGSTLASCSFSVGQVGEELFRHHEAGIGLVVRDTGRRKGRLVAYEFRIAYSEKPSAPLFGCPDLVAFLKGCEVGDALTFGSSKEGSVPVDSWPNLRSLGRMVRMIEAIYSELGIAEPRVTIANILDAKFADSYTLLNKLVESRNSGLENPLPALEPPAGHMSYRWQRAVLYCPLVVPFPEGVVVVIAEFDGEVATTELDLRVGVVGWRFTKATGLRVSDDSLAAGLQISRPLIVFNAEQAYELHDDQLRLVRPPVELTLKARLQNSV